MGNRPHPFCLEARSARPGDQIEHASNGQGRGERCTPPGDRTKHAPNGQRRGERYDERIVSMRWSVSSRPSSATLSKIPGEIVEPVSATRSGW